MLGLGLGLSLGGRRRRAPDQFGQLYAALASGATEVVVPTSLSPGRGNVWQDIARTVPALAPTDPVRSFRLRTLGGDIYATAANDAARPVLNVEDDCWYFGYNGVNQCMASPTITPGSDKVQVFVGVRRLANVDGVLQILVELSPDRNANNGAFTVGAAAGTTPNQNASIGSRGTVDTFAITGDTAYPSPFTGVLTFLGDISGDRATLRVNGAQIVQSTADQGAGNYGAYPLYYGARNAASAFFNGLTFGGAPFIRFGPNLSAGQIADIEGLIAEITAGVSL